MLYLYIGCLTFGIVYSAVSALLGSFGHDAGGADGGSFDGADVDIGTGADMMAGVDIDAGADAVPDGHGEADSAGAPSPFSPLVLASGITTFGAVGIISKAGFGMGDLASVFVSLGFAGIIGAAIFFGIVKFLHGSQSNSTYSQSDLLGVEAEVITPVPANGMGEIACSVGGVRCNFPAKSAHNTDIERGAVVKIKDMNGSVAVVARKITIHDYEAQELKIKQNSSIKEIDEKGVF